MRSGLLLLLFLSLLGVSEQIINFEPYILGFLSEDAILQYWQYGPAVGTVLLLAAIAIAQYGFLPIRPARLVAKLESRHLGLRPGHHLRRPRHAGDDTWDLGEGMWETREDASAELVETLLQAALVLGEAMRRYGTAPSAT